jgi:hypothetical protein
MSHTPGQWRWHEYYLLQDCPRRDGEPGRETNPFSTPCGHPIADDGSAGGEYNPAIDIAGADAHLIAAAPELLEVCRAARDGLHTAICVATAGLYDTRRECAEAANGHATIKKCDAAIAKAEGR